MMPQRFAAAAAALLLGACSAPTTDNLTKGADEAKANMNPAQRAYFDANSKMHVGMASSIHPDADVAFMAGMIPHHQGAVEMAEIVLQYGKDPEARALAEAVIKTQTTEIAQMEAWLKARGIDRAAGMRTLAEPPVDHSKMGH